MITSLTVKECEGCAGNGCKGENRGDSEGNRQCRAINPVSQDRSESQDWGTLTVNTNVLDIIIRAVWHTGHSFSTNEYQRMAKCKITIVSGIQSLAMQIVVCMDFVVQMLVSLEWHSRGLGSTCLPSVPVRRSARQVTMVFAPRIPNHSQIRTWSDIHFHTPRSLHCLMC